VSLIDYICVSGSLDRRMTEFADHLHEHFLTPVTSKAGRYVVPTESGFSIEMRPVSLDDYEFPIGSKWVR
jgi:L-fuconate dehydratase